MEWLLGLIASHWWTGLFVPVIAALPRLYRKLARMADNEWHLSQCNAREAALTVEVMVLRATAERAALSQAGGKEFLG